MAKILFGWEMGAGFGHLHSLLPIFKRLKQKGHQAFLVLRTLNTVKSLDNLGQGVFQAPYMVPFFRKPTRSLADILDCMGWRDGQNLKLHTMAWCSIVDGVRPDLIISDYSPGLNLAAYQRVPTVVLGTGFTVPPDRDPLPPMRPWEEEVPPGTLKAQRGIEQTMAEVCSDLGINSPDHLAQLFHPFRTYVLNLPFLDPYARHRDEPPLANLSEAAFRPRVEISEKKGTFFAYLHVREHPHTTKILEALVRLHVPCEAYVTNLSPHLRKKYASPRIQYHDGPQSLDYIFKNFKGLLHHGGSMCQDAAAAGLAQFLFPIQAEQATSTRMLADAGVAMGITKQGAKNVAGIEKALRYFLDKPRWEKAARLSDKLKEQNKGPVLDKIAEDCLSILKG